MTKKTVAASSPTENPDKGHRSIEGHVTLAAVLADLEERGGVNPREVDLCMREGIDLFHFTDYMVLWPEDHELDPKNPEPWASIEMILEPPDLTDPWEDALVSVPVQLLPAVRQMVAGWRSHGRRAWDESMKPVPQQMRELEQRLARRC